MPKHLRTTPSAAAKRADDRAARTFLGQMGDVVALVGTGTPTRPVDTRSEAGKAEDEYEQAVRAHQDALTRLAEATERSREADAAYAAAVAERDRVEAIYQAKITELVHMRGRAGLRLYRRSVVAVLREEGYSLGMLAWDAPLVREGYALDEDPGVVAERMAARSGL